MSESDVLQPADHSPEARPTAIRFLVLGTAFFVAVLLYLHRFILTYAQQYIAEDLHLTEDNLGWCQSAFFLAYALAQVPSGSLTDWFGSRRMLTIYILVWSGFTVSMGFVGGLVGLLVVRAAVGLGQAGAYPTCAVVVGRWAPFSVRAFVSSVIALGGRVGGALAPILVSLLIVAMVPAKTPESSALKARDLLDAAYLTEQLDLSTVPLDKATDEVRARQSAAAKIRKLMTGPALPPATATSLAMASKAKPRKFGDKPQVGMPALPPEATTQLVRNINAVLTGPPVLTLADSTSLPIEKEAKRLWNHKGELTLTQRTRLNRLILEAACPAGVRKVYADGWRPVVILLGSLGLIAAAVWCFMIRNRPQEHPWANREECELIAGQAGGTPVKEKAPFPWRAILTSSSLWNLSISQLMNNIGWAFLVTWLPRYLRDVHLVPFEERGWMASIPLWVGWFGMLAGGWATDRLTKAMGLKIGRSWPVGLSRFVGAAAFAAMLIHPDAWTATLLFAVVAFTTDFSAPPMWAYSQDVGGRNTAAILGWGNMWGNLGAALSPPLLNALLGANKDNWDLAFGACAVAFVIAGVTGMFIDATQKIDLGDEA